MYLFLFRDLKKNINFFIVSVNLLVYRTNTMDGYDLYFKDRAKVGLIKLNGSFFIIFLKFLSQLMTYMCDESRILSLKNSYIREFCKNLRC